MNTKIIISIGDKTFIALIRLLVFLAIGLGWIPVEPFLTFVSMIPPDLLQGIVASLKP